MPKNQRTVKNPKGSPRLRFAIAIMAAGKGTRLKSKHPKVLHAIGGKPLLAHVIRAASAVVPPADIYCIVGHEADKVREAVASYGTNFVEQREQRGTGHAIMQCREALRGYDHVLVLSGDVPLIRTETISRVRDFHIAQRADMTLLSALPPDPFGYGRVIRKKRSGKTTDEVAEIVEQKSASPAQQKIREINSGIYAFSVPELFSHIDQLKTNNAHREFYLTDMAELLTRDRKKVVALPASDSNEVLGVNTRLELASLDALLRADKTRQLMSDGVTIYRPETCSIDSDVTVAPDTVIEPFVQLLGNTSIGSDTVVRSYSVIKNSRIGDNVTVRNGCIMEETTVESGAILGPYSHLRPASHIGENAHVGNFVETKKTRLGRGSKANHLTYLGDAEIGEGVNVGAGTITCNYDGANKHKTVIEDGAFIGSDATLVAPVKVGRGAYVGAASCVTEDVPEDALAVGRGRQVNKEGWAKAKREMMKKPHA
ncbi:MAG: bifunctional UDP-N-acetylglucosamine diphosphorylase/glucosamine-1-phosphate N-acetyltransferase GlmU [Acidobacteriaceae bacterium]